MTKYAPAKTTKASAQPFSNNSSFYNNQPEEEKRHATPASNANTIEQQTIDEKRLKLNQEDYSPNKAKPTPTKETIDASKKAGHRRGYSMGQQLPPEKNAELEKQIEKHMQYQYQQQQQQQQQLKEQKEREQQALALQYQQQQQLLLKKQQEEQQAALQLQFQQQNQLAILDPQQEQDDYYAQFFNSSKMTFDFERQIVSQRGKSSGGGLFTPMASPANGNKKAAHQRTSSMGEEPKSSSRWQHKRASVGDQPQATIDRQNSELVELINMMENPEEKAEFVQYIQDRGNFEQVMSLLESRYRNEKYHHHK